MDNGIWEGIIIVESLFTKLHPGTSSTFLEYNNFRSVFEIIEYLCNKNFKGHFDHFMKFDGLKTNQNSNSGRHYGFFFLDKNKGQYGLFMVIDKYNMFKAYF